jgi:hypothetical protein
MAALETKFSTETDAEKEKNRVILRSLYEEMRNEITELDEDDINVL